MKYKKPATNPATPKTRHVTLKWRVFGNLVLLVLLHLKFDDPLNEAYNLGIIH